MTLLLTLFLLAGGWIAASREIPWLPARLLASGTIAAAAIIAIETAAGAAGLLRPAVVGIGAALVAAGLCAFGFVRNGRPAGATIRADVQAARQAAGVLRHPELALLALAAACAWAWILAAIRYLPPRSVDDLAHHLPPIFEAVIRGRFVILPLELRPWFSYPLNADLLALWPTLLRGDIRWTDIAQAATSLLAATAILTLARQAGATRRSSVLAALAFLLLPITIKQASSCYTDLSVAAFFGAALWGALRFAETDAGAPLLVAGISGGVLGGTKYHFLFPLASLTVLVLWSATRAPDRARGWRQALLLFVLPVALLSSFWYLRNGFELGNPFHPYRLGFGPVTIFPSGLDPADPAVADGSIAANLPHHPFLPLEVSLEDKGVGGVDGGLGPLFWALALPLGLWQAVRAAARAGAAGRERVRMWRARGRAAMDDPEPAPSAPEAGNAAPDPGRLEAVLGLQFAAALVPYLVSPFVWYPVSSRYLLAAVVPGAVLAALALDRLKRRWPELWAGACVLVLICSVVPLPLLAGTKDLLQLKQKMQFGAAARAPEFSSPWRFIEGASHGTGRFARGWELLDLLSEPPSRTPRPLWIYATGQYAAGFYGTRLQNRIWNFTPPESRPAEPDIWFYYLTIDRRPENITYFGQPVYRYADVALRPDLYDCILRTPETLLYVRRDRLLADADLKERLATAYEKLAPDEAAAAATLDPPLAEGTLVTSGAAELGLKALELRGRIGLHVAMARLDDMEEVAHRVRPEGPVYFPGPVTPQSTRVPAARMKGNTVEIGLYALSDEDFALARKGPPAEQPGPSAAEHVGEGP